MVFVRQERCVDPHHPDPVWVLIPLEMTDEPLEIRRQGNMVVFEVAHVAGWIVSFDLAEYRKKAKEKQCVCTCGYCY